ncbi:hypothetical protein [Streptomyces sp. G-5]|uniref:hypothetical protein n=1 Tax=Streptomyces sp. G-5 TaxID=2977231 RepID=UPI0021CDEDF2|nr:hypothetical protein [Streptomyces sp. G-5]MCU4748599.1 hypothetical protein [Streptomyces sp. G-5]
MLLTVAASGHALNAFRAAKRDIRRSVDAMPATYDSVAFSELVRGGNVAVLRDVLPDALPWSTFLPERDLDSFIGELVSTAQGAATLHHLSPGPAPHPRAPQRGDRGPCDVRVLPAHRPPLTIALPGAR